MSSGTSPRAKILGAVGGLRSAREDLEADHRDDLPSAIDVLEDLEEQAQLLADHVEYVLEE